MNQSFLFLLLSQAIVQTGNIVLAATATLIGLKLSEDQSYSTIPVFLNVLFTLAMTIPASLLFEKHGRKKIFLFGFTLGLLSVIFFVIGIYLGNYYVYCIGASLFGLCGSIANYIRYSAIEISKPEFKSKATSLILTGGVLAAFIGPNLSIWGLYIYPDLEFLGGYLVMFGFFLIAMILLLKVQFVENSALDLKKKLAFKELIRNRVLQKVIALSMISYWVMIFIMSATPLGMNHYEYSRESIASVLQYHVLGMFVPSFFTGSLIKKFGVRSIMFIGCILCFACVGINFTHHANHHFIPSLILLGIGWNFLFVGSTYFLTTKIPAENQSKSQALNDFMVFGFVAISLAFTGKIHKILGYQNLNLVTIPFLFLAVYLIFQLSKKETV
jgi:MFS family permease